MIVDRERLVSLIMTYNNPLYPFIFRRKIRVQSLSSEWVACFSRFLRAYVKSLEVITVPAITSNFFQ